MAQANNQSNKKEGSDRVSKNPKQFADYVSALRARIEKFKTTQQFIYCFMNEKVDLAVELYNAERVKEAWHLYRKISAELYELEGMSRPVKRVRYLYKKVK
jgi:hypothetical protein